MYSLEVEMFGAFLALSLLGSPLCSLFLSLTFINLWGSLVDWHSSGPPRRKVPSYLEGLFIRLTLRNSTKAGSKVKLLSLSPTTQPQPVHTKLLPRDKPHQCLIHGHLPGPTHSSSSAPSPCSRVSLAAPPEDFWAMMLSVQDAPVFPSPAKLHLVTVPASSLANESESRSSEFPHSILPVSMWWKPSGAQPFCWGPLVLREPVEGTPDRRGHPQEPDD